MKNHRFLSICAAASALGLSACPNLAAGGGGGGSTVLPPATGSTVVGHEAARLAVLSSIPRAAIARAKTDLRIAYAHTSHGSQIISGMTGLTAFAKAPEGGALFRWNPIGGGSDEALALVDKFVEGDLGNPNMTTWADRTRTYLQGHKDINVVMWSWCGQIREHSEASLKADYLDRMAQLEKDFPKVAFVYMTGHLASSTGDAPKVDARNEQVRKYCRDNKKWLFDFADIESYDPDGNYFGDKLPTDGCNYDKNGDGATSQTGDPALPTNGDANWALDWQKANPGEWYQCGASHTQPVNANMKAYAAWYLFARIAGWDGK